MVCEDKIRAEQEGVLLLLEEYVPRLRGQDKGILSLFCGAASDEPVILNFFGPRTELTSIDSSARMEEIAITLGRKSFKRGDLYRLDECVRGRYDLVLMRNPPIVCDENPDAMFQDWTGLLQKLPSFMTPESLLFITLLNWHEWNYFPPFLDRAGYRDVRREYNYIRVPNDGLAITGADSKDTFVILAKPPTWWSRLGAMLK